MTLALIQALATASSVLCVVAYAAGMFALAFHPERLADAPEYGPDQDGEGDGVGHYGSGI